MNEEFKTLSNIMDNRYSCRAYLSKEVTNENINQIVSTASKVPTWCNAQPWSVLVTKGNQTKAFSKALVDAVKSGPMNPDFDWPKQYTGEYQARRRVCGYQLYESLGIAREDRKSRAEQMMQNFKFFGAPHVAIITTESDLGPLWGNGLWWVHSIVRIGCARARGSISCSSFCNWLCTNHSKSF